MCGDEDRPNWGGGELTLILELGGSGELLSAAGRRVGGGSKGKGGRGGDGQRGNECGELHLFWILLIVFEILQEFLEVVKMTMWQRGFA